MDSRLLCNLIINMIQKSDSHLDTNVLASSPNHKDLSNLVSALHMIINPLLCVNEH